MEMSVGSVVLTVIVLPVTVNLINSEVEADSSLLDEESPPRLHRLGGTDPSVDSSSTNS